MPGESGSRWGPAGQKEKTDGSWRPAPVSKLTSENYLPGLGKRPSFSRGLGRPLTVTRGLPKLPSANSPKMKTNACFLRQNCALILFPRSKIALSASTRRRVLVTAEPDAAEIGFILRATAEQTDSMLSRRPSHCFCCWQASYCLLRPNGKSMFYDKTMNSLAFADLSGLQLHGCRSRRWS